MKDRIQRAFITEFARKVDGDKSFAHRFILRGSICDWLQVINADTREEAISLYDYNYTKYEVKEIENRKGGVK